MVAVAELDLQLDALEERRGRVEDDPVRPRAGLHRARLIRPSPSVTPSPTRSPSAEELDADACGRAAALGVEDVGGEGHSATTAPPVAGAHGRSPLVGVHEGAVSDDVPPPTSSRSTRCGPPRNEARDEILRAAELEAVGSPDGDVRSLAERQRADVVAAEHVRSAARAEPQRVPRGQRGRAAAAARDEQRVLHLGEQVAALVRRACRRRRARRARLRRAGRAPARRRRRGAGSTSGSARRRRPSRRTSERRRRRGGRSAHTRRPQRANRRARGTRPGCSRTARGSRRPPRRSRRGACAAATRVAAPALRTPPSAAS